MTLIGRYPLTPSQQALLATMVASPQKPLTEKSFAKDNSQSNKGSSMKRLIGLAGVAVALASTENAQAIPFKPDRININRVAELDPSSAVFAKSMLAEVALTLTANKRNASLFTPVLSSLSLQGSIPSATFVNRNRYVPESLVAKFNPQTPTEPSQPKTLKDAGSPAGTALVADGGATASLLGIALLGTVLMKRKLAVNAS